MTFRAPPATIEEILRGPHIRSLVDAGDPAPIVVVEPFQFIGVRPVYGRQPQRVDAADLPVVEGWAAHGGSSK